MAVSSGPPRNTLDESQPCHNAARLSDLELPFDVVDSVPNWHGTRRGWRTRKISVGLAEAGHYNELDRVFAHRSSGLEYEHRSKRVMRCGL